MISNFGSFCLKPRSKPATDDGLPVGSPQIFPPIYLNLIFERSSLKFEFDELDFYFLLPVEPAKFKFEIDKKSSSSKDLRGTHWQPIFRGGFPAIFESKKTQNMISRFVHFSTKKCFKSGVRLLNH